jgi:hypothetical protein
LFVLIGAVALVGCGSTPPTLPEPTTLELGPAFTNSLAASDTLSTHDVPLLGNDWQSAALLDPRTRPFLLGTAADPGDEPDGSSTQDAQEARPSSQSPGTSSAGLPATQNAATLDGLSTVQSFSGAARGSAARGLHTGASFGEASIRNLRIAPRDFTAESGGAGNIIAIQTRGGSGRLHGTAFALTRQSAWAAANPFSLVARYNNGSVTESLVKPHDALWQAGASVGGKLPRHALAGFASVEAQFRSAQAISAPATPSFFSLTPTQIALLGTRGVTTSQTNAALNFLDSLMGPVDRSATRLLAFARADADPTRRDHLTLAFIGNDFHSPTGSSLRSDAVIARGRASFGDATLHVDALTAHWQHTFSPHWSLEARAQVARDLEYESPRAPLPQEPAVAAGGYAPQITIGPLGFTYGTPNNLGRIASPDERRSQAAVIATLATRRHVARLGLDWSRIDDRVASETNPFGTFSYDSGVTGGKAGGLVDWITDDALGVNAYPNAGCPSITAAVHRFCFRSFAQSFGTLDTSFVTQDFAAFAEDAWRPRANLLLSAGARWEYTLLPLPQQPNPVLDEQLRQLADPRTGYTSAFPEDRNNFAPRVGVVYANRFVSLRLGYGLFFGRLPGATLRAALADTALPTSVRRVRITPTTEVTCPQNASVSFGYPCDFTSTPPAAVLDTAQAIVFSSGFRLPAVQRGTLTLERRLFHSIAFTASYSGAIAMQLPGSVDLNIAPAITTRQFIVQGGDGWPGLHSGSTFTVPLYTARRFTQFGPVTAITSHANATYHSVDAELHARFSRFTLRTAYTFSHAIDYGPQLSATPRTMTQFDPFTAGYDKARSTLDYPNRFAGALLFDSSWTHGPRSVRSALSGWHIAALGVAGSGAPYSYGLFGGTYLTGGHESINGAGGATYLPSLGRNTLRLPPRGSADVRLSRAFSVHALHAEAFAEAFNVLNSRNLSSVETRAFLPGTPATAGTPTPLLFQDAATIASEGVNTPPFGAAVSSTTPLSRERQLEIGIRAAF